MKYKYLKDKGENTWIIQNPYMNFEEYIGFVYQITNIDTGMIYIGIKKFWEPYNLKPLKGNTNKRKFLKETKWRQYNSSGTIAEDVKANPKNYEKEILRLCKTVTDMKAYEAYTQLQYYFSGNWNKLHNQMINLRLRIRK